MKTIKSTLFSLAISVLLSSTAYAGVNLKAVELDVLQKIGFGGYIDQQRANELATLVATEILKEAGVLDQASTQQATLYIGYYRRFIGDETPFPVNNLVTPQVSEGFKITQNGAVTAERHRIAGQLNLLGIKGMFRKDVSGKYGKNFKRDLKGIASASALSAKTLVAKLYANKKRYKAFAKSKNPGAVAALNTFFEQLADETTPEFASIADSKQYIPEEVALRFRTRVASEDPAVRTKAYKELFANPINDKLLLDKIKLNLLTAAATDVPADAQAWAAKALGASGFSEYREALQQTVAVTASKKVKKHAKRALTDFDNNATYAIELHDTSNWNEGQSWQSLQVVNQLNTGRLKIQTAAAKRAYREGKAIDDHVKTALARQLEQFSMNVSMRSEVSGEFHAWALKALAAAGDKKYLPLMNRVAKQSINKKTRKYAKASAKILKKS